MLENGQLKLRLGPELAATLNRLAQSAGLTPEAWIRSAIVAHGGRVPGPFDIARRVTISKDDARKLYNASVARQEPRRDENPTT